VPKSSSHARDTVDSGQYRTLGAVGIFGPEAEDDLLTGVSPWQSTIPAAAANSFPLHRHPRAPARGSKQRRAGAYSVPNDQAQIRARNNRTQSPMRGAVWILGPDAEDDGSPEGAFEGTPS
jgi:hypothetical protein